MRALWVLLFSAAYVAVAFLLKPAFYRFRAWGEKPTAIATLGFCRSVAMDAAIWPVSLLFIVAVGMAAAVLFMGFGVGYCIVELPASALNRLGIVRRLNAWFSDPSPGDCRSVPANETTGAPQPPAGGKS